MNSEGQKRIEGQLCRVQKKLHSFAKVTEERKSPFSSRARGDIGSIYIHLPSSSERVRGRVAAVVVVVKTIKGRKKRDSLSRCCCMVRPCFSPSFSHPSIISRCRAKKRRRKRLYLCRGEGRKKRIDPDKKKYEGTMERRSM